MSGIVQVGGVALASHDSGTDKVSLDSGTVFPAGHVIQKVILKEDSGNLVSVISTESTTFESTIIAGSFTTKMSSSDSMLYFQFFSGSSYVQHQDYWGQTTLALTTSSNTTHADANDTLGDQLHKARWAGDSHLQLPVSLQWFFKEGTRTPSGKTDYDADEEIFARIFIKTAHTDYVWQPVADDTDYILTVEEVTI